LCCSAGSGVIELILADGLVVARAARIFYARSNSSGDIGALTFENESCTDVAFDAWSPKSAP
jgi:hypothetical protein